VAKAFQNSFLGLVIFYGLLTMIIIPALWELGSRNEGYLAPVVRNVVVKSVESNEQSVQFTVEFEKVRSCEFIGVNWYRGPQRLALAFGETSVMAPLTRSLGRQITGRWTILDIAGLFGTRAEVMHRCHPLWITTTHFYP